MDDLKGIPKKDFEALSEILGHNEALRYIKDVKYNYQAVAGKLLQLKIKALLRRKPILIWTIFVVTILFIAYYIFDTLCY